MADKIPQNSRMYPVITISLIKNPNRLYAIPFFGFFIKLLMLIPVGIEFMVLAFADLFILLINSFIVLFTGKYWKVAYDLNVALIRISIKINFFLTGLTNKYPGFSLAIEDEFSVDIPFNKSPNRFFAIPIVGGIARFILLFPYLIYSSVIGYASNIAVFFSWVPVLVVGKYPETTFEITRDTNRISQAIFAYMSGLSDTYPSFWVSMNHKTLKIILIILGVLALIWNNVGKNYRNGRIQSGERTYQQYQQQYLEQLTPTGTPSSY